MKTLLIITLVLGTSVVGLADIARPENGARVKKPVEGIETAIDIKLDKDAKEARLIIPRSRLKQLRAELDALENGKDQAVDATGIFTRTQTIAAGFMLSLSLVLGGMWFARSGRGSRASRSTVGVVAIGLMAFGAGIVYSNAGPPPEARGVTSKMFSQAMNLYGFGYGKVKLETSDLDRIQLIVPKTSDKPGD